MSYILEALKKAQAERQLGSAPTLDAVPVGAATPATHARRLPVTVLAAGAIGLVLVASAAWWWMAPAKVAPAPAAAAAVVAAPAPTAPVVSAPVVSTAVASAPIAVAPALAVAPPSHPAPAPVKAAVPVSAPASKPTPTPAPAESERLPALRDLPENVRAAIPTVTFGGYMYSNNPADRLILVDKVLRHEGEEVAPGLVLEKLLPKAAVMNYRGSRYQVAY